MKILPLVVIFCLLGSLVEAIFILPGHVAGHAGSSANGRTTRVLRRMQGVYRPVLDAVLNFGPDLRAAGALRRGTARRLVTVVAGGALFAATIGVAAAAMGFQLNAPGKPYETTVNFRLAPGTSRATSEAKAERLRAAMLEGVGEEAVVSAKSRVGSSLDRDTGLVEQGANVGQIRFEFAMSDALLAAHPGTLDRIKDMLTGDPDVRSFSVDVPQAGPPAGAQIEAPLSGRGPDAVLAATGQHQAWLARQEGVEEAFDNLGLGKETFRVEVDRERAAQRGLSERAVGQAVRSAIDGLLADEVSIDETQVEIVVRYRGGVTLDRQGLGSLPVVNARGEISRLDDVARLVRVQEPGALRRRDGQRQIEVLADLDGDRVQVAQINEAVQRRWDEVLGQRFPGVTLAFGGETEDFNESLKDLIPAFGLVIGLIFVVLALQFKSYLQPLIILSAVPFGIIGAIWGLFLMGYDLSLFAFFGIVALAGIVVNDSLVMVDFINKRVEAGDPVPVAVIDGALANCAPSCRPR